MGYESENSQKDLYIPNYNVIKELPSLMQYLIKRGLKEGLFDS